MCSKTVHQTLCAVKQFTRHYEQSNSSPDTMSSQTVHQTLREVKHCEQTNSVSSLSVISQFSRPSLWINIRQDLLLDNDRTVTAFTRLHEHCNRTNSTCTCLEA
ncbi:hypothetical protein BgiBS90_021108 [Biomphalaria glabrata]|nr:hypothetical protein BgiBS90_021108 [Biomphalaria glabrata]